MEENREKVSLSLLRERYAFLDPAGGKQVQNQTKKGLARSAIVVVAPDPLHRLFVLEAWARRVSTPDLIEEIFRVNSQWQVLRFGVEANAMQSLFADAVALMALEKRISIQLLPIFQNTRIDKMFRIKTALQPILADGRLILGEDQIELRNELKAFPRGQTVDLVDALASVVKMVPDVPEEVRGREEADSLAKYLRQSGVPARYIEERMARFFAERGIDHHQRPQFHPVTGRRLN